MSGRRTAARPFARRLATGALALALSGCAVWAVHPSELQRGDPGAMVFGTGGGPTYAEVWNAAVYAMGRGMHIEDSDRASGTLRARIGAAPTGKVVALFITPASATAPEYRIELVGKAPMGLGQPERRTWEPQVARDLQAALRDPTLSRQAGGGGR